MPGPVPKRTDQLIRRNKPEVPVDTVTLIGDVEVPDLDIEDPHPMIEDFYYSLAESGQAKYYEPSDWQNARIVCHFLNAQVKSSKPSGQMMATLHSMLTDMMVTEGSRRRLRMEIEREQTKTQLVDVASILEKRLAL